MTDPESILQLGIEAAKEGNTEEARSLFRLLTREQPDNPSGWLWLAGVAESRDERQLALERVVELDPDNQLARQSLQAMQGPRPTTRLHDEDTPQNNIPVSVVPVPTPAPAPAPVPAPSSPERSPPQEEDPFADDPFAELDNLSAIFHESPEAVRREEPAGAPVTPVAPVGMPDQTEQPRGPTPKAPKRAAPTRSQQGARKEYGSAMSKQNQSSSNWVRILIGTLVVLCLIAIALVVVFDLPGRFRGSRTAGGQPPGVGAATPTIVSGGSIGLSPTPEPDILGAGSRELPTETPPGAEPPPTEASPAGEPSPEVSPAGEPSPEVSPAGEPPTPPAPESPQPAADLSAANPAIVPANTPLESNGWSFDFNNPSFATSIFGGLGAVSSQQGRYVVVLTFVANSSGQTQSIPADFFVLKDAQGRVYSANPQASTAYINQYGGRGVAADLSQEDPIPPDGLTRSVPILFDVPPGATDLVFFARSNPNQGWLVLQNVP